MGEKKNPTDNIRINLRLFLLPIITLIIAYCLGKPFELLAFLIWGFGGIYAFWIVMQYGYTDTVPVKTKEAALWFLFGDLIVSLAFCLEPV